MYEIGTKEGRLSTLYRRNKFVICKERFLEVDMCHKLKFHFETNLFYQFFTAHVMKNNHYIPFIFTLLKDKNQESYINIFQIINNYCLNYDNQFEIKKIDVDFEVAIHNAINEVWPLSEIRGFRFHLGQSWYGTIQKCIYIYNRIYFRTIFTTNEFIK